MADPRQCAPAGNVLLTIQQSADPGARVATATTKLYDNGAWTRDVMDAYGSKARTESGCVELSLLDSIRADLRGAKWTTTRRQPACRASSPRFTRYVWRARTLFTDRVCSREVLDNDSRHALDRIEVYLHVPEDLDGVPLPRGRWRGVPDTCSGVLCK